MRAKVFLGIGLVVTILVSIPESLWAQGSYKLNVPLGLDADQMEIPKDNPLTASKVELGKLLFFDPRLSVDDTVACASNNRRAACKGMPNASKNNSTN